MKAISLHRPWATLAILGHKPYETRSWATKYRGQLLIHATRNGDFISNWFVERLLSAAGLNHTEIYRESNFRSGLVGKVMLTDCEHAEDIAPWLSVAQLALGDFSTGRYAWKFENPTEFKEAIPCRGWPGLWNVPPEIAKMIEGRYTQEVRR